jgi:UDP-N-acetylmuramyl pentapeptide phosphotransferase/UDP-N-acetylglucosamine-1-phosphate transferase
MAALLVSFVSSYVLTMLVLRALRHRGEAARDHDLSGPQKVHVQPVIRVGGVGIVLSLAVVAGLALLHRMPAAHELALLLVCGLPAFMVGLVEDLTKRVPPRVRLFGAAISALLAVALLDTAVRRTDLWVLDWVAALELGAAMLSIFTAAGLANAVNIIDGFNGLASMCVMIILLALAYVAQQVGDDVVLLLALAGAGATAGFFVWNYPLGLLFLGDGGAYFLGFYVAEVSLLLIARNPEVSPLFPLLVAIYPVFETVFSMYRRRMVRGRAIGLPDGVHLHSLIYRRLLRFAVGRRDAAALTRRNSMTAPYLWLLCMLAVVPGVIFWDDSRILGALIVLFCAVYVSLYALIIRFKAPRWLVFGKSGQPRR